MSLSEQPLVTVSLITYNHARFIEQAVESVLAQQTTFPFELVIGEDESSDGTREIVQRLAAAHPDRIRLNLHSRSSNIAYGGRPTGRHNFVHNLRSARGKYIATVDGDDYWTHPLKLQRQVDFLESRSDCAICFHRSVFVDENGAPVNIPADVLPAQTTFSLADYLEFRFSPPSGTLLFRRGLFVDFPEWFFRSPVGDFPLNVMNAQHGDFGFIDESMAAYRIHAGGMWSMGLQPSAWSVKTGEQQEKQARRWASMIALYEIIDGYLGSAYRPIVRRKIAEFAKLEASCHRYLGNRRALRRSLWKAAVAEIGVAPRRALRSLQLLGRTFTHPQEGVNFKSQGTAALP